MTTTFKETDRYFGIDIVQNIKKFKVMHALKNKHNKKQEAFICCIFNTCLSYPRRESM